MFAVSARASVWSDLSQDGSYILGPPILTTWGPLSAKIAALCVLDDWDYQYLRYFNLTVENILKSDSKRDIDVNRRWLWTLNILI